MKIGYAWICEHIDAPPPELKAATQAFIDRGLEVESVDQVSGDSVFEFSITPNRADCFGARGLARELAASFGLKLKEVALQSPAQSGAKKTEAKIDLEGVREACPRFSLLQVSGIRNGESPDWVKQRLEGAGIRPKSLIVDATNYVMLDLCQPNHAYDTRFLDTSKGMGVRFAKAGENMETLDEKQHKLSPDDLVICNGEAIVGMAGVMGGKSSEVREDTTEVWIEAAVFDPAIVRKMAKRHTIKTDASHRFERGVDIQGAARAGLAVAHLIARMQEEQGGPKLEIHGQVDVYPHKLEPRFVALRPSRAQTILGAEIETEQMRSHLESLGLRASDTAEDRLLFEVPSHRHDIEREADLVEEVGRMHGFDNIKPELPRMSIEPEQGGFLEDLIYQVKCVWAASGYNEMVNYAFIPESFASFLDLDGEHPLQATLSLKNPLSDSLAVMQPTLSYSALAAMGSAYRGDTPYCRFFECGRVFHPPGLRPDAQKFPYLGEVLAKYEPLHLRSHTKNEKRPIERFVCSGIMTAPKQNTLRHTQTKTNNVYVGLKHDLRSFLFGLGCEDVEFWGVSTKSLAFPYLYPGQIELVRIGGQVSGYLGRVHPAQLEDAGYGDKWDAAMFEIDLGVLQKSLPAFRRGAYAPAKYPASARDYTAVVPKTVSHEQLSAKIREANLPESLERFELVDLYTGEHVAKGQKSMSYRFYFRNAEKTLKDKEVDQDFSMISDHLDRVLSSYAV